MFNFFMAETLLGAFTCFFVFYFWMFLHFNTFLNIKIPFFEEILITRQEIRMHILLLLVDFIYSSIII
jgi:hypothetical protein